MRRMRSNWQYVLFAVPVVVVAVGLSYLSHHQEGDQIASKARGPVSVKLASTSELHALQQKLKRKIASMTADEDSPHQDLRVSSPSGTIVKSDSRAPASVNLCNSSEFPGGGPDDVKISKKQWNGVMDQFHQAKALLTAWLDDHRAQFSKKTFDWMKSRIEQARLQRPPSADEPDLAWRGIGVAHVSANLPLIRLGGGFPHWVSENPRRARFELARLLAQAWAPCQMKTVDSSSPWKALMSCMQLGAQADLSKTCGRNSYSEAGWAVSTAVAAAVSPPGCQIPAFQKASVAQCMDKMGISL